MREKEENVYISRRKLRPNTKDTLKRHTVNIDYLGIIFTNLIKCRK